MASKKAKRHLAIEVIECGDCKFIRISKQTHRRSVFHTQESEKFEASNGFELGSCDCPEITDDGLWVQGEDDFHDDDKLPLESLKDPDKWLEELRVAVSEYNETDGKGFPKERVIEVIE